MDYAGLLEEVKKRLFEMGFGDMWFDEDIVECLKQNNHDLPKTVEFIISAPKPADFQVQGKKAKKQLAKEQQKKENEKKQKEQTNKKRDQKIQQQSQYDEPKTQPETNRPPRRNPPRPNPKYSNPNYQNHTTQYEDYDYEEEDDQYSSYPRPPPPTLLPAPQPEKAKPAPPPTSAITTPAVSYSDKVLGHAAPQPAPTPALAPVPAPSAPVAKKSAPAPQYRPAARQPQTPVYKPKAIAPEAPPKDTPPVPPPQAPTDPLPAKQPQRPPKEAPAEVSDPPTSKEPNEKPTQPEDNSEKQRRNQNTNTRGRGRGRGGYRGGRGANNNKTKAQWQEKKISPPPKVEETQNQQGEDTVEVVSSTTKGKTRGVKLPDNLTNELEDLDIEFGNEDSALPDGSEIVIVKQETLVDASPQGDGFSENGVEASSNSEKATEQHPPESVPRPAQAAGLRPPEPSQASQQPAPSQSAHPHHSNPDIPNSVPPMVQFQNMMPFGVLSPHSGHVQQHMAHVSPHSIPMMPPPYPAFEAMEHGGMGFYDGQYPIHGPSYSQMSVENGHETGASMNINEDNQSSFNPGHGGVVVSVKLRIVLVRVRRE
uniref:Uncharacterized protein n=1 Tax=Arcella intermedia TaxID=1963864 RepID=A0A6B2L002_9EUKA